MGIFGAFGPIGPSLNHLTRLIRSAVAITQMKSDAVVNAIGVNVRALAELARDIAQEMCRYVGIGECEQFRYLGK